MNSKSKGAFGIERSRFCADTYFSGRFEHRANFNMCLFMEEVRFKHTRNVVIKAGSAKERSGLTASRMKRFKGWTKELLERIASTIHAWSKKHFPVELKEEEKNLSSLFYGETHLENIRFEKPSRVFFDGVDLAKARFLGTALGGVGFLGCNFYQPGLRRNGIFDEGWVIGLSYIDKMRLLPAVEQLNRDIRLSLEHVKSFSKANDFYVGEIDCRRRQLSFLKAYFLSIPALYKVLSDYGTSALRPCLWFFFFGCLHAAIIAKLFPLNVEIQDLGSLHQNRSFLLFDTYELSAIDHVWPQARDRLLYSLQVMTLQQGRSVYTPEVPASAAIGFLNLVFQILGPALIAVTALALRVQIRRF
ncbi:hypothetical protein [Kineobactrum salinum]|uniref:Uncharacterized protein n=1 Tax=Kineobactrum salinum TaxID=2708301 RepID=A0A6C0U4C5_9GAMM|nr:hypothetical protein [Kineobactrum salinum]QIB66961.1 hypothetical protein G3T16_17760 [Kineobactrum salinum]